VSLEVLSAGATLGSLNNVKLKVVSLGHSLDGSGARVVTAGEEGSESHIEEVRSVDMW
jgi:hypothetical protein